MRLPLSGIELDFRPLDGHAEALIADLPLDRPVAAGVAVLEVLTHMGGVDPRALTLSDFEQALAAIRCHHIGDLVISHPYCTRCGERVELSFSLGELARGVAAEIPRDRSAPLAIGDMPFRLPTAGDVLAVEGCGNARKSLLAACVEGPVTAPVARRIERAMARIAPLLSRVIEAPCAACGAILRAVIHLPGFVMAELAWEARGLFDDVHELARGYGWREPDILALPRARRRRYAARLREGV